MTEKVIGVKMMDMNDTLKELIIGIFITTGLLLLGTYLFIDNNGTVINGIIFGSLVAVMIVSHMFRTIGKSINLDSDDAIKYTQKVAIIRAIVMVLAIGIAMTFPKIFHVVGVFLGMMGLKVSAYFQPTTKKYITNKIQKKGR